MITIPESVSENKRIFCNKCGNETNHILQAEYHTDYPNENPDGSYAFVERLGYRFWVCAGCGTGTLEEYYVFDINNDYDSRPMVTYYPERTQVHIEAKTFKKLPGRLTDIYREILRAYNGTLRVLCALGIRALLEGICADKGISGDNLKTKIDNMIDIPLPENIVQNLHSLRFIGNDAAHELEAPSGDELKLAISICEDLLNYVYELDYKASQLATSRASRHGNLKPIK